MAVHKDLRGAQASGTQGPEDMGDARQSLLDSPWRHTLLVILELRDSAIHPILRKNSLPRDMEREEDEEAMCGVPQFCVHCVSTLGL